MTLDDKYKLAMNRLNHWGMMVVGQIFGSLRADDSRAKGMRDIHQKLIILRAEVNALTNLLHKKGILDMTEFTTQIISEAKYLEKAYEQRFPGVRSIDEGLDIYDVALAQTYMKDWPK